jgi:hypothetical protein
MRWLPRSEKIKPNHIPQKPELTRMNAKTRNRLIVLFIVTFPIMVLIGFVISEYIHPPK